MDDVREILKKYDKQENQIDEELTKKTQNPSGQNSNKKNRRDGLPTIEEAKARNKKIIMEIESVKGNLRSKAIFSPIEMQWDEICNKYLQEPSLTVTTWKCHLPAFV